MSLKVPLHSALIQTMENMENPDPRKVMAAFFENMEEATEVVGCVASVLAVRDEEIESSVFLQIAYGAMFLAESCKSGMKPSEVVNKLMDEANQKNKEKYLQAVKDGTDPERLVIGGLTFTDDGFKHEVLTEEDFNERSGEKH